MSALFDYQFSLPSNFLFSADILRELTQCVTSIFLTVDIKIATSLYARARQVHLLESQGNFWNRLRFVVCKQMSYALRRNQWEIREN